MEIIRNGSQPSTKGPAEYFTGNVRIDSPFQRTGAARVAGAFVTFEPGARSNWHTHPIGQTLIVTSGKGWTQCDGGPVVEINAGDIVWCPPGHRHWHGATPTTATALVKAVMNIGSSSDVVAVRSDAEMTETHNVAISTVIDHREINDLPLDGRLATQLVLIAGASVNVTGGDLTGSKQFFSSQAISVAGSRGSPNLTIDSLNVARTWRTSATSPRGDIVFNVASACASNGDNDATIPSVSFRLHHHMF